MPDFEVLTFNRSCAFFAVRSPLNSAEIGTGCANVIPSPATRYSVCHLVRASPRHPASVRTCSMWFPVLFRFLAHSLTNVRSLGLRRAVPPLAHVVGDSAVVLSGMSRQIALQTRSEALRRTRRGLNARQGMEGAKNAYRAFQEVRRADPLARGFQVARNRASPLQSPFARYRQSLGW